jgi:prepilin-type processing-associated H-X9-DG protein
VIAILGILAGMLLPALARARESAHRAACLSNLKQLGLAIKQYAQDFKDVYPWSEDSAGNSDPTAAWKDLGMTFPNYCTGFGSFICPSSRDRKLRAPDMGKNPPDKEPLEPFNTKTVNDSDKGTSFSYCFNYNAGSPIPWTETTKATVRLLSDKRAGPDPSAGSEKTQEVPKYNHEDDGRNLLYQDGHVAWKAGMEKGVDPDEDDDSVGTNSWKAYKKYWADPPFTK